MAIGQNLNGLPQWKCQNGHILGVIRRDEVDNAGCKRWATRLLLFRQAIDPEQAPVGLVDVIAIVEGTVLDVCCSVPGCVDAETHEQTKRTWHIGAEAIESLLARKRARAVFYHEPLHKPLEG